MAPGGIGQSDPDLRDKLEQKIGVSRMWKLYLANGKLRFLTNVILYMSDRFHSSFVAAAKDISTEQWRRVILSGSLWDISNVLHRPSTRFLAAGTKAFEQAVLETAGDVVRGSDWYPLNGGHRLLDKCPASRARDALSEAIAAHLSAIDPKHFQCDSMSEAVHAVDCLWRERPDLRGGLDDVLQRLLPSENPDWTKTEDYFRAGGVLLQLLRHRDFADRTVTAYMSIVLDERWAKRFADAETIGLFLYYWNAFAVWHERVSVDAMTFRDALPCCVREKLISELARRAQLRANPQETANLLALAGLLAFVHIEAGEPTRLALRANLRPEQLRKTLSRNTFVPAFFSFIALEQVFPELDVFAPAVCKRLLAAVDDYDDVTPSIEHLRALVVERL